MGTAQLVRSRGNELRAIVLAALHPERVQQLAVYGSSARLVAAPGYPDGLPPELATPAVLEESFLQWGDDDSPTSLALILPTQASNPAVRRALAGMQRRAGSPRAAQRYFQVVLDTDVRDVLPMVRTPTLVLHVRGDRLFPVEHGRYLAREIPDARLVEIEGHDHYYFWENADRIADELETFITGRARRLVDAMHADGLEIRAGLHAGEVEWIGEDIAGIAVHIAARVCALAGTAEVLATSTLRDLTAGSDLAFVERGQRELRGVPGGWSVLEAAP